LTSKKLLWFINHLPFGAKIVHSSPQRCLVQSAIVRTPEDEQTSLPSAIWGDIDPIFDQRYLELIEYLEEARIGYPKLVYGVLGYKGVLGHNRPLARLWEVDYTPTDEEHARHVQPWLMDHRRSNNAFLSVSLWSGGPEMENLMEAVTLLMTEFTIRYPMELKLFQEANGAVTVQLFKER
jgi:hypothetical protein